MGVVLSGSPIVLEVPWRTHFMASYTSLILYGSDDDGQVVLSGDASWCNFGVRHQICGGRLATAHTMIKGGYLLKMMRRRWSESGSPISLPDFSYLITGIRWWGSWGPTICTAMLSNCITPWGGPWSLYKCSLHWWTWGITSQYSATLALM